MVKAVAIITISDTCFKDHSKDTSGPTLADLARKLFPEANIHTLIIPDEKELIERELRHYCDTNVELVLTTGGTGIAHRDVTPEATKAVIQKEVPGISIAITLESLKKTPMAMLSRSVAGIRDKTLIINFPGSKKAVEECFEVVRPVVLSHAIALLQNDICEVRSIHDTLQFGNVCSYHSKVDITKVAFRPRESPYPMVEMSEAWRLVDDIMGQWPEHFDICSLEDCYGRVVAQALSAMEPMPPFDASVKDGYACISADGAGARRVRTSLTAGDAPTMPLMPGECARINTGAALPSGADCVVQVEDTKLLSASEDGQTELEIEILVAPKPKQDVRPIGSDISMGTVLVKKGDVLDSAQIGMIAGAGYEHVTVRAHPKVALMSTGNELQEPSEMKLKPAHIRDSNRIMLKTLLREYGYESVDCGIVRDCPSQLVAAIAEALRRVDVLVCTGGVSMGERDLLKPVLLKDFNATIHFGRIRMKPGKPSTFATCEFEGKTKYIFALPGNPVSAYVCCLLLVVRGLRAAGGRASAWPRMRVRTSAALPLDPRPEYARATVQFTSDGLPTARVLGNQCSSRLLSACGASVLLELPAATEDVKQLPAGSVLPALITGRFDIVSS